MGPLGNRCAAAGGASHPAIVDNSSAQMPDRILVTLKFIDSPRAILSPGFCPTPAQEATRQSGRWTKRTISAIRRGGGKADNNQTFFAGSAPEARSCEACGYPRHRIAAF